MEAVQKAREFFEAMNEAKKAMAEYDKCDDPTSGFWRIPEYVQDRYLQSMETFGKFLAWSVLTNLLYYKNNQTPPMSKQSFFIGLLISATLFTFEALAYQLYILLNY